MKCACLPIAEIVLTMLSLKPIEPLLQAEEAAHESRE